VQAVKAQVNDHVAVDDNGGDNDDVNDHVNLKSLYNAGMKDCTTCYGTGEIVTDQGAQACPDCFGGAGVEWRLRALEQQYSGDAERSEAGIDVRWLIHELRCCREALLHIMTRCQDADAGDELARDVKYQANEALGLYVPSI